MQEFFFRGISDLIVWNVKMQKDVEDVEKGVVFLSEIKIYVIGVLCGSGRGFFRRTGVGRLCVITGVGGRGMEFGVGRVGLIRCQRGLRSQKVSVRGQIDNKLSVIIIILRFMNFQVFEWYFYVKNLELLVVKRV